MHEASQVHEQVLEGHVGGLERDVVQQGRAPQEGVVAEQDGVQRGQALLSGVEVLQAQLSALAPLAPHLEAVVDAPQVVGAWGKKNLFVFVSLLNV